MKRLRNIAIYYIVFGIACALSFVFFNFFWVGIAGLLLLIYYYIAKYVYQQHKIPSRVSATMQNILTVFFVLLPLLALLSVELYYNRSFKQMIIVPENYEGIIVVGYGDTKQSNKQWKDGYRVIKVNSNGIAKTSFTVPEYIGSQLDGTLIHYSNDLNSTIPIKSADPINNDTTKTNAYIVDFTKNYQIYILTKRFSKFFKPKTFNEPDSLSKIKIDAKLDSLNN
ncbi:DUF6843 domain-containing protein [Mucilaginibacter sp. KACC 22063]|uniref:DUF6843 domain-containing protein n=1 Tax=Mucilaginibacter sp. KACC 22063 TaxID=3025666 RepID=UPI002366DF01|nr:hypothetical protein [Mucilaginibacter sp. KACC 22063]WDF53727.1 hypothetical protein PQ461_12305 [Mucilaginibacter sp. KACC 22063]